MLLMDVDGVMTDGRIVLDNQGVETKAFHVRDGRGIKLLQHAGVVIGIITGRSSEVVKIRCRELGITEVHQGAKDKLAVYEKILEKYGLQDDQIAYIGDDDVDISVFKRVGLAAAVADADPSVHAHVHLFTKAKGGSGAVRELINFILKSRGQLPVA
jgi:3-deoxy-D-manno-octulosonate 8-phosphate phosphatase (KDO 8-P phosphatase)